MSNSPTRAPVLLISTDFDGTLIEHGSPAPFSPSLVTVLTALRGRGVRWAINTGRTLDSLAEGLESFALPVHPDFALTAEREIYQAGPDGRGWVDFGDWNERCAQAHKAMFEAAGPALREVTEFVERETGAELRYGRHLRGRDGEPELAGLVATDTAEMDRIVAFVDRLKGQIPNFSYQRNAIYLSFCHADYDKGTTLAALGRALGLGPEAIFAVGDQENDLPMLTGQPARHTACPANSSERVKETVRRAGGYVAREGYSAGVIEALRFYCEDFGV